MLQLPHSLRAVLLNQLLSHRTGTTRKIRRSHIFMNGWYVHIYSLPFTNVRNDRLIGVKALESMCKIYII